MSQPTKLATRADYRYFLSIPTRAVDLDLNGHVNQSVYYNLYETLFLTYIKKECEFEPNYGDLTIFCVENGCNYRRELTFPQLVETGARIAHIGNSSVRFESALFTEGYEDAAATGFFILVFVDIHTRRPVPIPEDIREKFKQVSI